MSAVTLGRAGLDSGLLLGAALADPVAIAVLDGFAVGLLLVPQPASSGGMAAAPATAPAARKKDLRVMSGVIAWVTALSGVCLTTLLTMSCQASAPLKYKPGGLASSTPSRRHCRSASSDTDRTQARVWRQGFVTKQLRDLRPPLLACVSRDPVDTACAVVPFSKRFDYEAIGCVVGCLSSRQCGAAPCCAAHAFAGIMVASYPTTCRGGRSGLQGGHSRER